MNRLYLLACLGLWLGACGGGSDADSGSVDMDGSVPDECEGAADGTPCGGGTMVCSSGTCVAATGTCGDGVVDDGEACDDGNTTAFDGCEPDCTFTCESDAECDDGVACNGAETCGATTNVCEAGTALDDGAPCSTTEVPDGVCVTTPTGAACIGGGCGNGVVEGAEQCDDANEVAGDGCENDCRFSCETDEQCDDGLFCSGVETCDVASHTCAPGTAPDCADGNDCTEDNCDELAGACANPLIDNDEDGYASVTLGACGDDCNDRRADVYPGAEELCDSVDNNCDGAIDEVAPTWYVDCDGDGYAASADSSRTGCEAPPASTTGCPGGGGWTSQRPIGRTTTDCADDDADAFPGQTTYFTSAQTSGATDDERYGNYNCDAVAQRDHTTTADRSGSCTLVASRFSFLSTRYVCSGTGWTGSTAPLCGGSGSYVDCGRPLECVPRRGSSCLGYSLVCEGPSLSPRDPCYCPRGTLCTPDCVPGSSGCAWHYYRCSGSTTTERMGCR